MAGTLSPAPYHDVTRRHGPARELAGISTHLGDAQGEILDSLRTSRGSGAFGGGLARLGFGLVT